MFKRLIMVGAVAAAAWFFIKRRRGEAEPEQDPARLPPTAGTRPADLEAGYAPADTTRNAPEPQDRYRPAEHAESFTGSPLRTPDTGPYGRQQSDAAGAVPPRPNGAAESGSTAPARTIKGNNRAGEKLYHLPDDQTYDQVIEERLFATREEAEAAGYHHATQPS